MSAEKQMCDICNLEPATWGNKLLLGTEHKICYECFVLWYDSNVADVSEIRERRLAQQQNESV